MSKKILINIRGQEVLKSVLNFWVGAYSMEVSFFGFVFFFCFPVTYVNIAQNSSMVIIYYCILFAVKSTSQMWIKERENLPNFLACFGFKAHSEIYCENVHTNILDVCVSSSGTWWCLLEFFISRSRGHQQLCLHTLTVTGPWRIAKSLRKVR